MLFCCLAFKELVVNRLPPPLFSWKWNSLEWEMHLCDHFQTIVYWIWLHISWWGPQLQVHTCSIQHISQQRLEKPPGCWFVIFIRSVEQLTDTWGITDSKACASRWFSLDHTSICISGQSAVGAARQVAYRRAGRWRRHGSWRAVVTVAFLT